MFTNSTVSIPGVDCHFLSFLQHPIRKTTLPEKNGVVMRPLSYILHCSSKYRASGRQTHGPNFHERLDTGVKNTKSTAKARIKEYKKKTLGP